MMVLSLALTIYVGFLLTLVSGKKDKEKDAPFICTAAPEPKTQLEEALEHSNLDIGFRSFLLSKDKHWPRGIVPYEMDSRFSQLQKSTILDTMKMLEDNSCVRWVVRRDQTDFVRIEHSPDFGTCSAQVGRYGSKQYIFLNDVCFDVDKGYRGAILHEMMHTLGFIHEQQRLDRDCYVSVTAEAIEKLPDDYAKVNHTSLQFPYDFKSIMHYGTSRFLKGKSNEHIGHVDGRLTKLDIMKLNNMYCGGETYCEKYVQWCAWIEDNQRKCVVPERSSRFGLSRNDRMPLISRWENATRGPSHTPK